MENNEKELEEIKVIEEREIITTEEDMDKNDTAYNENNENNENREFYVYAHIRLDKMETFYIGKGKGDRAYELDRNDHHDNISNEYGHAVIIIENNLTEDEAYWLERDTIEDYVFNLGYGIDIKGYDDYNHELPHLTNMNWGGRGVTSGLKHSEETKIKISKSLKGIQLSEETKLKISEANKGKQAGKNHYLYGKHHSDETKQKMSESRKGKYAGKNHPLYGKHHSDETKLKISESCKGRKLPKETKKKMSENNCRKQKVICITTGKIFNTINAACHYYNVVQSSISLCCIGKYKSAGKLSDGTKLQWKYLENYDNEFKGILINPWNKGKKLFEEYELKLSKVNSKKVICITTGKIFNSQTEAGNYYKSSHISDCCKGIRKSTGKLSDGTPLKWKYVKDYNNEFKGILINPITD